MKKIKQLGKIAFLALAISFGSCSSDDGGGSTGGGSAADGTITAKVEGKTVTTIKAGTVGVASGNLLTLSGATMNQEAFSITVYNYTGNGTYDAITGNEVGAVFSYTKIDLNDPQSTHNTWYAPLEDTSGVTGTITVTESSDTNVKGTFSFKGVNDLGTFKNVTNGSFNVALNQQGQ